MAKTYKALMVVDSTHKKIVIKAKKEGITIDQFINQLLKNKMKKIIFALAFSLVFVGFAGTVKADTCGLQPDNSYIPCGNGSPENTVNVWGTKNSQLPHILQGQSRNGFTCPVWYPMYCVDITGTSWYQARFGR